LVAAAQAAPAAAAASDYEEDLGAAYSYSFYYSYSRVYSYSRYSSLETCSPPSSSIEVCLSSIFSTIESSLSSMVSVLKLHEVTIKYQMHHEHTLLYSEVSWVSLIESIASSVKSAVEVDYYAMYAEWYDLLDEKIQIYDAYAALMLELGNLEGDVADVQGKIKIIYEKYVSIRYAKWSIYSAISAIVYEKMVIIEEEVLISYIVSSLNEEVHEIYEKIYQLYARQVWLEEWEYELYVDLYEFQEDIVKFREIESELYYREYSLYLEQEVLLEKVEYVEYVIGYLMMEYEKLELYIYSLQEYYHELELIFYSISEEAEVFVHAYEEFVCEDSLLYYEACSSTHVVYSAAPAPVVSAPKRAPASVKYV